MSSFFIQKLILCEDTTYLGYDKITTGKLSPGHPLASVRTRSDRSVLVILVHIVRILLHPPLPGECSCCFFFFFRSLRSRLYLDVVERYRLIHADTSCFITIFFNPYLSRCFIDSVKYNDIIRTAKGWLKFLHECLKRGIADEKFLVRAEENFLR